MRLNLLSYPSPSPSSQRDRDRSQNKLDITTKEHVNIAEDENSFDLMPSPLSTFVSSANSALRIRRGGASVSLSRTVQLGHSSMECWNPA